MFKFGTDGWRAIISDEFTFENVRVVSQAIADHYKTQKPRRKVRCMIVGYDTRFLSAEYAETISRVMAANGFKVVLTSKATPTPVVSFTIKKMRLDFGIVVTASHNPAAFNGIKIKASYGGPAQPEVTRAVENLINKRPVKIMAFETACRKKMIEVKNCDEAYFTNLEHYLDMNLFRKKGFKVIVDVMHGAGVDYIATALKKTPSAVEQIRTEYNPSFGGVRPEPIPENLNGLIKRMKDTHYDLAIANDGDADRFGFIAPGGRFITPGEVLGLVILHFVEDLNLKGAVVKTVSNSSLIDAICDKLNLTMYETPVGFKHIGKYMLEKKILVGGEESGGIGVMNYVPERDGILLGLLLLQMMAYRTEGILALLKDMENRFGVFRYERSDIHLSAQQTKTLVGKLRKYTPDKLAGKKIVATNTADGIKLIMKDGSWILFRPSGTEPIMRVYAESASARATKKIIAAGIDLALAM